jgi:FHA domain
MAFTLVGLNGPLAGNRYDVGDTPITFGRRADSVVRLSGALASRAHAELRRTDAGYVIHDLGSSNGTRVNGALIKAHTLAPGDEIAIGEERFRFEIAEMESIILMPSAPSPTLRVTIAGGGPVGLTLALLLEHLLGPRVAITIYDGRWMRDGDRVVWKGSEQGNTRRQQVVTIQSRQYLNLPPEVQERLFTPGNYTEMWPAGPDSVQGQGPRNIRIAHIETLRAPARSWWAGTSWRSVRADARAPVSTSPPSSAPPTRACTRWRASTCTTSCSACG